MIRYRSRRVRIASITVAAAVVAGCGDDGPSSPHAAAAAVVVVVTQRCERPNRLYGFGVRVDDGTIVTAAHNVDGDLRDLRVNGRQASVSTIDPRSDLAVVHVPGDEGPEARIAPAVPITAGTPLWLLTLDDAVRDVARVDGVRPTRLTVHDTTSGQRFSRQALAFGPAVAEGTSGAPLVTAAGDVAGIVAIAVRDLDLSYAASASEIASVSAQDDGRTLEPPPACA